MEDDGILFEKTHRALAKTASEHGFPLLLTNLTIVGLVQEAAVYLPYIVS